MGGVVKFGGFWVVVYSGQSHVTPRKSSALVRLALFVFC